MIEMHECEYCPAQIPVGTTACPPCATALDIVDSLKELGKAPRGLKVHATRKRLMGFLKHVYMNDFSGE